MALLCGAARAPLARARTRPLRGLPPLGGPGLHGDRGRAGGLVGGGDQSHRPSPASAVALRRPKDARGASARPIVPFGARSYEFRRGDDVVVRVSARSSVSVCACSRGRVLTRVRRRPLSTRRCRRRDSRFSPCANDPTAGRPSCATVERPDRQNHQSRRLRPGGAGLSRRRTDAGAAAKRPCPHGRERASSTNTKRSARASPAHVQREAPSQFPGESEAFARIRARRPLVGGRQRLRAAMQSG
jgi:hypothetical protein